MLEESSKMRRRAAPAPLDAKAAQIDREAREGAIRAQQGWMASLLSQASSSALLSSPNGTSPGGRMPGGGGASGAGPSSSPTTETTLNGKSLPDDFVREVAADDAAVRAEAVRVQQDWLASLLHALSPRGGSSATLNHDAAAASVAAPIRASLANLFPGEESEADSAVRQEALHAQRAWLGGLLNGIMTDRSSGSSYGDAPGDEAEPGEAAGLSRLSTTGEARRLSRLSFTAERARSRRSSAVEHAKRPESPREQRQWLIGLLGGLMSPRSSVDEAAAEAALESDHSNGDVPRKPVSDAERVEREEALRVQREWLGSLLTGLLDETDESQEAADPTAVGPAGARPATDVTPAERAVRDEALRVQRAWLQGLLSGSAEGGEGTARLSARGVSRKSHTRDETAASRAARAEALRVQRAWLASLIPGMMSPRASGDLDAPGDAAGDAANSKPPRPLRGDETEEERALREEALRVQREWLVTLLAGLASPRAESEAETEEARLARLARGEALAAQRAWLAATLLGANSAPPSGPNSPRLARTTVPGSPLSPLGSSLLLAGASMRRGVGSSLFVPEEPSEEQASAHSLHKIYL